MASISNNDTSNHIRLNDASQQTLEIELMGENFVLHQNPNSLNHGLAVWDAGIALCKYFENCKQSFVGKRVLDLGAGCGLVSAFCFARGASVVSTDLPDVTELLKQNLVCNGHIDLTEASTDCDDAASRIVVMPYCWGDDTSLLEKYGPYDFIMGTDVVYSSELIEPLLESIVKVANSATHIFLANEIRDELTHEKFIELSKKFFRVKKIPQKKLHSDFQIPTLHVYHLRLR